MSSLVPMKVLASRFHVVTSDTVIATVRILFGSLGYARTERYGVVCGRASRTAQVTMESTDIPLETPIVEAVDLDGTYLPERCSCGHSSPRRECRHVRLVREVFAKADERLPRVVAENEIDNIA